MISRQYAFLMPEIAFFKSTFSGGVVHVHKYLCSIAGCNPGLTMLIILPCQRQKGIPARSVPYSVLSNNECSDDAHIAIGPLLFL